MNYSVLLNRSVDFDTYAIVLDPAYPDELNQQLVLSMVQMLWDRGESNGYAHRITDNPLPNTPPHEVLMNVGVGDHQVSNFTPTRWLGRSARRRSTADRLRRALARGRRRSGASTRGSRLPAHDGSALVYWDSGPIRDDPGLAPIPEDTLGTNLPPIENIPNRPGNDPHELPRRTDEEQEMVSTLPAAERAEQHHRYVYRGALLRLHVQRSLGRADGDRIGRPAGAIPAAASFCSRFAATVPGVGLPYFDWRAPERFKFLAAPANGWVFSGPTNLPEKTTLARSSRT